MALKKSFSKASPYMNGELGLENCYWRVPSVNGSKNKVTASVSVLAIVDGEISNQIASREYSFTPSVGSGSKNFIAQAYEHIKSLPEFLDAEDV